MFLKRYEFQKGLEGGGLQRYDRKGLEKKVGRQSNAPRSLGAGADALERPGKRLERRFCREERARIRFILHGGVIARQYRGLSVIH